MKTCVVSIGGPAALVAGVVRGREAVGDARAGRLRGDCAFKEIAGELRHLLRVDHTGGAVGLPQQPDGFGVIEPEWFECTGDAVRSLRVVRVDERFVRDDGRHDVEGWREGERGVTEKVKFVVDPAPVVRGIRNQHVQIGATRCFVDGAQTCGRAAQGGIQEAAVKAMGMAADHADEFPARPRIHDSGAGGVADRDDLFGEAVRPVEGATVTGLRVDEVGERVGEGGNGGLMVGF